MAHRPLGARAGGAEAAPGGPARGHQPGDQYLFIEFDDAARELRGYETQVPSRGPKTFKIRTLGAEPYPRRWDPRRNET